MIKSIKKIMRQVKKGFTLVEVIIVLVIIAILSAIIVPSLIGYIDKSRSTQYIMYARSAMTAAQTTLDEMFADGVPECYLTNEGSTDETKAYYQKYQKSFRNLIEDTGVYEANFVFSTEIVDDTNSLFTNATKTYKIIRAAYIYKESETGNYTILYYNGESWIDKGTRTKLKNAASYVKNTLVRNDVKNDGISGANTRVTTKIYSSVVPEPYQYN